MLDLSFLVVDKDRDVKEANYRLRKDIEKGKDREEQLHCEILALQQQLADAKQGLLAASRLSDQLEISNQTISRLKQECK